MRKSGNMNKEKTDKGRGARIRFVRVERMGLGSQEAFAEVLSRESGESLSRGAVGNWELGRAIKLDHLRLISRVGQVPLEWLTDGIGELDLTPGPNNRPSDAGTVPIVGYVGAGAAAHYYAVSQGDLDRVEAPPGSTPSTVAAEIKGDSIGRLFNTWLVFYDDVRSPVTSDLIGRLCVVGLLDDRILVKQIKRSTRTKGLYDLISNTDEPTIEAVEIAWAARVKTMTPR